MVGFALVVVLGSVVTSIETTLRAWLDATFGAEISVGTSPGLNSALFDNSIVQRMQQIPGVQSVEKYRKSVQIYDSKPVILVAFDYYNHPDRRPLILTEAQPDAYELALKGAGVFVSESFAHRYRKYVGDLLTLETSLGAKQFPIVGLARDYTMDLGTILIPYDEYVRLWSDTKLTYAHIWTARSSDLEAVRRSVNAIVNENPSVSVVTSSEF
jgi:hypothetical protein